MTRIKTIPSTFLNNPSISLGSKGLYSYINAKNPLWIGNADDIACETSDTPENIGKYEGELISNEYMERKLEYEKENKRYYSYTLLKKSLHKKTDINTQDAKKILAYWNAKGVVVHRVITPSIEYQIERNLGMYTLEDILLSIDNYTQVYKSKITYWEHKWTLEEFLKRPGGMGVFLYKTEKDFIDKNKIQTAAAKEVILAEKKETETEEQREERIKRAKEQREVAELQEYYRKLPEEIQKMIVKNTDEDLAPDARMKQTHPYMYDIKRKQSIKRNTKRYQTSPLYQFIISLGIRTTKILANGSQLDH